MPRTDPLPNFGFLVEIDGIAKAAFAECSGLEAAIDVIEYREGNEPNRIRKLPGLVHYTAITLKRGLTQDKTLWEWFKATRDGNLQRRNGSITLLDTALKPVLRWVFSEAWPSKWEGPKLNAKTSDLAIETLVIEHEGLELVD